MHNLFRGGNTALGTSALRSVEGKGRGNDDVGNGMCKIGGIPDGGVLDRGGDNGSGEDKGNGDGDAFLNRIPAAL
ncbi:hypothetical protein Tco_0504354 [Tanacetum coccineum]